MNNLKTKTIPSIFLVSMILFSFLQIVVGSSAQPAYSSENDHLNSKKAAFITATDKIPFLHRIITDLQSLDYTVDIISGKNVTVDFLKYNLTKYEVIFLRLGAVWHEGPYRILTQERVGKIIEHSSDILAKRVYITSGHYAITERFFTYYYGGDSLNGKLIILLVPNMGMISHTLINQCGADVTIGFDTPYLSKGWGMPDLIISHIIHNLVKGKTVGDAVKLEYRLLIASRWGPQRPFNTLTYSGDEKWILSTI